MGALIVTAGGPDGEPPYRVPAPKGWAKESGADPEVVTLFAFFHDSRRVIVHSSRRDH